MLDPQNFRFTGEANYLNHPPPFYLLLAKLGLAVEGHPASALAHRLINILLVAIGLTAVLAIGFAAGLPREQFYAYAVPIVFIPVLAPLAGAVNNDNLAFVGGAITTLAAWQLAATGRKAWLGLALLGMIAAAWAKLTGLLLSAGLITTVCLYLVWRGRVDWRWLILSRSASQRRRMWPSSPNTAARCPTRRRKSHSSKTVRVSPVGPTCRANHFRLIWRTSSACSSATGCRRSRRAMHSTTRCWQSRSQRSGAPSPASSSRCTN